MRDRYLRDRSLEGLQTDVKELNHKQFPRCVSIAGYYHSLNENSFFINSVSSTPSSLYTFDLGKQAREGYLGQFLLCMCRWPLRAPTPF